MNEKPEPTDTPRSHQQNAALIPGPIRFVTDFVRAPNRPIGWVDPVDGAGWTHKIRAESARENGNLTSILYEVSKAGVVRLYDRVVFGPDLRTSSPENLKIDGIFPGLWFNTVYIGVTGHSAPGDNPAAPTNGGYTLVYPGAWWFWEPLDPAHPTQTFTDVPPTDPDYRYIEPLGRAGIITGHTDGSGRFGKNESVRRVSPVQWLWRLFSGQR